MIEPSVFRSATELMRGSTDFQNDAASFTVAFTLLQLTGLPFATARKSVVYERVS